MSQVTIESLNRELLSINSTSKYLQDIYDSSKVVDLKEVGEMLIKVQKQLKGFKKNKTFITRITNKFKFFDKVRNTIDEEISLQQNITEYIETTLHAFDEKYQELIEHLKVFKKSSDSFSEDIVKLDEWIDRATIFKSSLDDPAKIAEIDRLITEAKTELKRKHDTVQTLISPMLIAGQKQTQNINELTPILKNILYDELKTMIGINSFRDAADMMVILKDSIVEIQKLNIHNSNEAILSILNSTKNNLLSKQDIEEMDAIRKQGLAEIGRTVQEIQKTQIENQKFMEQKYQELKSSNVLEHHKIKLLDQKV